MNRFRTIVATVVSFGLAMPPLTVLAEDEPLSTAAGPTTDVVPVAVWTIAGVLIMGVVATVFYLLKRRVGGFPANPAWKAPITIMPSKDFADEGAFGDVAPDAHGAHH